MPKRSPARRRSPQGRLQRVQRRRRGRLICAQALKQLRAATISARLPTRVFTLSCFAPWRTERPRRWRAAPPGRRETRPRPAACGSTTRFGGMCVCVCAWVSHADRMAAWSSVCKRTLELGLSSLCTAPAIVLDSCARSNVCITESARPRRACPSCTQYEHAIKSTTYATMGMRRSPDGFETWHFAVHMLRLTLPHHWGAFAMLRLSSERDRCCSLCTWGSLEASMPLSKRQLGHIPSARRGDANPWATDSSP